MMHNFLIDLRRAIQSRVGIACDAQSNSSDGFSDFVIRSSESEYRDPYGWFIHVEILNETFRLDFGFDESAGLLCKFYFSKLSSYGKIEELLEIQESFEKSFFPLSYYCDDRLVTTQELSSIQTPLNFRIKAKGRLVKSEIEVHDPINLVLEFLLVSILPLLPDGTEEDSMDFLYEHGLPEGASKKVLVNKYERDPRNRLACIKHYGTSCAVCGFDFGKVYGEFASDYIHVHHIVPVSQIGENYIVNPVKDLIPLCPNCHSAVHIANPPLSPEELRTRLKEKHIEI
jgi:5-methylcytosine-specific restriction protein A